MSTNLRALIRDGIQGAVDTMRSVGREVSRQPYTDRELAERYRRFHQGKPRALLDFVRREAPPGADLLQEGVRYERKMERLIREREQGG